MATIITRSGKGSPLTNNEVDANFTNLNSDKIESGDTVASLTITNADINGGDIASGVTVNKSPQLTLTGDVTGTVTFTNLANGSMATTASADLLRVDGDGSDLQNVRAETIEVTVKNVSGGSLAKGTPVHQTGTSGAATFEVVAADASNASVMPAHFVLLETLANGAEGRGLLMGRISGVNTAGFAEGDTIYVAAGGGYTNVAPTGEGNLIQNLGTVTNVDATNGGGEVMGAGRSAATPNLNNGNIFIGNASNQAVTASLSTSVSNAGFATTSYVDTAVANLVDSAPAALDTLNELAAALGDDANFSTTVTNSIATKQDAATALTTSTTFGGDVSGTYNAIVVADDSHNHIISNVDGLQAALDAKQAASTALTTSTTFGGDVSGTYNAIVIADDSHNHVISNVDGLQTALNAKQDASTAVTTTTTFGGDVSGTYDAIVVADNSHSHVSSNISDFTESVQDVVGGMVSTNTENGISVTYDDTNGKLNFDVSDPTITLTGAVTGSGTITNLGNVSIATTNTADPTLTLAGDASGSATFTNLGNATLTVTVADDSHNHIIGNVDGLQTALDAKQDAATAVTTTTTFGGDVSGTYDAIVIADDSHNHVISNVDGLQTALDAKQNASTALTTSTTFGGDVSGTYNAIVVADDSHNHIIGNVDGLQTALDGKLGSTANAVSASKWATARTVSLTGAVTGSASVDGSANVSIATTHTADPTITLTGAVTGSGTMTNLGNVSIATTATADPTLTLSGDASGSATFTNLGNATLSVTVANDSHTHDGRYFTETESDGRYLRTGADSVTSARLAVGAHIGSRSPGFSVEGDADSSPFVVKTSARATAFAVLPWTSGYTYLASGIYYDDGAWIHSSDNSYNCLLEISGTSGARWYASSDSSSSWNLSSATSLWNNAGTWTNPVVSGSVSAAAMYVDQYIYHNGDTNTYIDFQADRMRIVAGGVEMIDNVEGGTDYVEIANAQLTVYTNGNAALTGSLTYNPSPGSISTAAHEGSINYVYNSAGGTPTRGDCSVHVYQQHGQSLSLSLTDSSWQTGDIVRVSNVYGGVNITVSATRIYTPDGSYDTSVTFNGTVGGFVLAKYNGTTGYWMVMP